MRSKRVYKQWEDIYPLTLINLNFGGYIAFNAEEDVSFVQDVNTEDVSYELKAWLERNVDPCPYGIGNTIAETMDNLLSKMNNEKINNKIINYIINEAWEDYSNEYDKDNSIGLTLLVKITDGTSHYRKLSKDQFTGMILHDNSFANMRGFKIEKRELTRDERFKIAYRDLELMKKLDTQSRILQYPFGHDRVMDEHNIPKKITTVTYKNQKIESYE